MNLFVNSGSGYGVGISKTNVAMYITVVLWQCHKGNL